MVVQERLKFWPEDDKSWLMPIEVAHELITGIPNVSRVCIDRRKNIRQMLDVRVLRRDPSFEPRLSGVKLN